GCSSCSDDGELQPAVNTAPAATTTAARGWKYLAAFMIRLLYGLMELSTVTEDGVGGAVSVPPVRRRRDQPACTASTISSDRPNTGNSTPSTTAGTISTAAARPPSRPSAPVRRGRAVPLARRWFTSISAAVAALVSTPPQTRVGSRLVTQPNWLPVCMSTPKLVARASAPSCAAVASATVRPLN